MKTSKIKLKWKIFAYVLVFAVIVIAIFCIFQIGLLSRMYKKNKINSLNDSMNEVSTLLKDNNIEDVKDELSNISTASEVSIYLYKIDGTLIDNIGNGKYFNRFNDSETFSNLIHNSMDNKKVFFITFENSVRPSFGEGPLVNDKIITSSIDDSVISGLYINYEGENCLLILDARISPVEPAVTTLQQQLFYISIIVLIVTIIIALVIANIISKPIKNMTIEASRLASGERDVTFNGYGYEEIIELNKTLNYAVEELNKTDTLQKELLANISHDLKTPLTLISGYAQMMLDMKEEVTEENIKLIVDEVNYLNVLVNDLLNLSRLQAKTEVLNFNNFDLDNLVKENVDRLNSLYNPQGIKISYESNASNVIINGDEKNLSKVINNFINNAVSYRGDSDIINVILEVKDNKVKLMVKDYGIGINEEDIPLIWNRYYRVDKNHNRKIDGSGLGLAIVKEILDLHHYDYGVISHINEGSTFYFECNVIK